MGQVAKIEEHSAGAIITPAQMIERAIESGSGIEVMERLLALQERHDAFQARKLFDDAMADLRKNLPKIVKSRKVDYQAKGEGGGRVNYSFEDLAEITEALAGPMSEVGLSFRWYTDNTDRGVKVTCRITHRDGHFEETSLVGPLDTSGKKNPIQAIGSAVTYLQRYTLKAAVGIAAAHDDDARSAGKQADDDAPYLSDLEDRLNAASSLDDLKSAWEGLPWDSVPQDWHAPLTAAKDKRLAVLRAPKAKVSPTQSLDDQFPGDLPSESAEMVRNYSAG